MEWLIDIKDALIEYGVPVLVAAVPVLAVIFGLILKNLFKLFNEMIKYQIKQIKDNQEREDVSPAIDSQSSKIEQSNQNNVMVAEMVNILVQESTTNITVKEKVNNLYNNVKFGNDFTTVSELKEDLAKAQEDLVNSLIASSPFI